MVKTTLQYNNEVLTDYFRFQILKRSKSKYGYYALCVLCALIGAFQIVFTSQWVLGVIICVIALILMVTFPLQIKLVIKKQVKDMVNHIDVEMYFDDEGIHQQLTNKKIGTDTWDKITLACENSKYFYFFSNKYEALIASKSILSEEDIKELKGYIESKKLNYKLYK